MHPRLYRVQTQRKRKLHFSSDIREWYFFLYLYKQVILLKITFYSLGKCWLNSLAIILWTLVKKRFFIMWCRTHFIGKRHYHSIKAPVCQWVSESVCFLFPKSPTKITRAQQSVYQIRPQKAYTAYKFLQIGPKCQKAWFCLSFFLSLMKNVQTIR